MHPTPLYPHPVLTWRGVAGLCVTGLHLPGLGLLQAAAVAGWPDGTDDLAPPNARAAALGALGPEGWACRERTGTQWGETLRLGVPTREGGWKLPGNACQTQGWSRVRPPVRHPRDQDWAAATDGKEASAH